jgi:hypothetical protein
MEKETSSTGTSKKKPKIQYSSGDGIRYEQVFHNGELGFAVFNKQTKTVSFTKTITGPIVPRKDTSNIWEIPEFSDHFESPLTLYREVRQYIFDHMDFHFNFQYDVTTAWVMATWLFPLWHAVPYLDFTGENGSGKTRAEETLCQVSYRGIIGTGTTPAAMYRMVDKDRVTLFFDQCEHLARSEEKTEYLSLINSGYRKGGKRIQYDKDRKTYVTYKTFGFKAFDGTKNLEKTLEDRCIVIPMYKTQKIKPRYVDEKHGAILRGKLLNWRFMVLSQLTDGTERSERLIRQYTNDPRLMELFSPLVSSIYYLSELSEPTEPSVATIKNSLIEALKTVSNIRLAEEQSSIEAQLVQALLDCESYVVSGKLSISSITLTFNLNLENVDTKFFWRPESIGRRMKVFGFQKCRMNDGSHGIYWSDQIIQKLKARYIDDMGEQTNIEQFITVEVS